jgi:hypothetical protein
MLSDINRRVGMYTLFKNKKPVKQGYYWILMDKWQLQLPSIARWSNELKQFCAEGNTLWDPYAYCYIEPPERKFIRKKVIRKK